MSSSKILTEIESGFSNTLTKLLLLFGQESNASDSSESISITSSKKGINNGKSNLLTQIMKNKFSISIKTMEFILNICNHIEKAEWEKHVSLVPRMKVYWFGNLQELL